MRKTPIRCSVHATIAFVAFLLATPVRSAHAQSLSVNTYSIGSPVLSELYVDGAIGDDENSGTSQNAALRTVDEAWRRVPQNVQFSSTGYRINIAGGYYPESSLPNYWESRYGTYQHPIILQPLPGATVTFGGDMNIFDTRYLYILDITIAPSPAGDAFHCEACDHVLLRRVTMNGGNREAHETVKVNQSTHFYIEDSNIHGAEDNVIDFVAVQYGHIVRNRIHNAQDWCAYVKGGSAYITIEGNEISDCGTGGFTAGQGTGFEFMTAPWLHYEAYDIKFINNIIHDTEGAAFGVNGGYNILIAFNTAVRVGSRDHAIEVVFGNRSCDGDAAACAARRAAGGWGPAAPEGDSDDKSVPNKNVFIQNNVVYNPVGYWAPQQIFAIYGPRMNRSDTGLPEVAYSDDNLRIQGNIIWNLNPYGVILGAGEDGQGCAEDHPTCNTQQLLTENALNTLFPEFRNATGVGTEQDLRPSPGSSILSVQGNLVPAFDGANRPLPPLAPVGMLDNSVLIDRGGHSRAEAIVVGAYASADSPREPIPGTPGAPGDDSGGGQNPPPSGDTTPPLISKAKSSKSAKLGKKVSLQATVKDAGGIQSVVATIGTDTVPLRLTGRASKGKFKGTYRAAREGVFEVIITATDTSSNQSQTSAGRVRVKPGRRSRP